MSYKIYKIIVNINKISKTGLLAEILAKSITKNNIDLTEFSLTNKEEEEEEDNG